MAELAGTAVGVASLGIQVCQGLVSYLHSFRERTQSITEMLSEVSSLVSIFYLIEDIAPKLDQEQSKNATAIRNCLGESEQKLLELQTFVLSLRGPEHCNTRSEKVRDAARSLLYPFREGKIESLRKTLQALLDHLGLAVNTATLESNLLTHGKLDSIIGSIDRYDTSLQTQQRDINNLATLAQRNSSQISVLGQDTKTYHDDIVKRLDQSDWIISDSNQHIIASLELIRTDARSTASNNFANYESMKALLERENSKNDLILHHVRQLLDKSISDSSPANVLQGSDQSMLLAAPRQGAFGSNLVIRRRKSTTAGEPADLAACSCAVVGHPYTFSFTLGSLKLKYKQENFSRHSRGCKYYGIDKKKQKAIQLRFPLSMGFLSSRMTLACIDFVSGNGVLGTTLRYTQRVQNCPVQKLIHRLVYRKRQDIYSISFWSSIVQDLQSTERAIKSLYRDRKASPSDLSEFGLSHLQQLMHVFTVEWPQTLPAATLFHDHVVSAIIEIIQTLKCLTQDENTIVTIGEIFSAIGSDKSSLLGGQYLMRYLSSSFEVLVHFPEVIDALETSSLAYAILRRSLTDLENSILRDPATVQEQFFGLTCLELSVLWPEGLKRLLKTTARDFLDRPQDPDLEVAPIINALKLRNVDSSQALLAADCVVDLDSYQTEITTPECARLLAIELAERRRRLLALAEQGLGVDEVIYGAKSADIQAASLCRKLDSIHIPIPLALRVPTSYTSIYHCKIIPLQYFKIFFDNGFPDLWSLEHIGLTPAIARIGTEPYHGRDWHDHSRLSAMQWLVSQGFFDQKPVDRLHLGLNIYANGWHYVAGRLGSQLHWQVISGLEFELHLDILLALQPSPSKTVDNCSCWCSTRGGGCSTFRTVWKEYANAMESKSLSYRKHLSRPSSFLRHNLFHQHIWRHQLEDTELLSISLDLIRFLTFEVLEMTHTCCSFESIKLEQEEGHYPCYHLIMNPNPNVVQEVRSSSSEQEKVALLDELMEDFAEKLNGLDWNLSSMESFIWRYWRRRISELFIVKPTTMADMHQLVENLTTHVLPERVKSFLGSDFQLLKGEELDIAKHEKIDGEYLVNKGESTSRPHRNSSCKYCDRDKEIYRGVFEDTTK